MFFTNALLHEYNLLEIQMKYNLLSVAALRELPKIVRYLREIVDNYDYFNTKSIVIIINMAVITLNLAADVMLINGELIGAGTYACRKSINHSTNYGINRSELCDFLFLIETIRRRVADDNQHLLQEK